MDSCQLCGLPFRAAHSALPKVAAAAAAGIVGCTSDCSMGQRVLRAGLTGLVAYAGAELLTSAATKVCRCGHATG